MGRKGNIGGVLPDFDGQGGAVTRSLHPRQSLSLYWATTIGGGLPLCTTGARWRAFQLARGSANRVRLLLRRYVRQDITPASTHAQLIHFQKR